MNNKLFQGVTTTTNLVNLSHKKENHNKPLTSTIINYTRPGIFSEKYYNLNPLENT